MTIDWGAFAAIVVFLLIQTGALVYWAGTVTETLKVHGRELSETRAMAIQASNDLAFMKGQRGIAQ
jgi:hypothetical protein